AMRDPDARVRGEGLAKLTAAGIQVDTPCCEVQAREVNPGYVKRSETGLPRVRVKLAMSLDGRTAMASGESQWITGVDAREAVQLLRAESCAIVTGIGSVLADDPRMTVRTEAARVDGRIRQPLRVLVDSELRAPLDAALFEEAGPVLVATATRHSEAWKRLEARGAEILRLEGSGGRIDLAALVRELGRRGMNEVLVEAGATLAAGFLARGLIDELTVFIAPVVLGSSARPLFALPELERMGDAIHLEIKTVARIGQDCVLVFKPVGL
ncbi:MAG: bifunctional diaminohydroxyphosphoribosylaminopyrimidine deaminase/5-amino-6-(5-phosphoribosylamino)uracil reductase RibD, partial [Pseudomonadales bacterium]